MILTLSLDFVSALALCIIKDTYSGWGLTNTYNPFLEVTIIQKRQYTGMHIVINLQYRNRVLFY